MNGFAIIDILKRDLVQIIIDFPLSSLLYNSQKKILFSSMNNIGRGKQNSNITKLTLVLFIYSKS